jgi:hypothetical protein
MNNQWKARDMAARLLQQHGRAARTIVQRRWEECGSSGDVDAVAFWVNVGIEVGSLLEARLSLDEVLDSSTTKRLMKADGVSREDVDAVLREAKSKRQ